MKFGTLISAVVISALLGGCASGDHEDLKDWMKAQAKDMKGKVPPLPEIKAFPVVAYEADSILSPFAPGKIVTVDPVVDKSAPDKNRAPQPLESFPLEDLKVMGVVLTGSMPYALIQTPPPNKPKYVVVGEYMGQNYGRVTAITKDGVTVLESVKDTNGVWVPTEKLLLVPREGGR